jgi:hypothetical protein
MAVQLFTPVAPPQVGNATNNIYNATLGAGANSTVITVGNDAIIRVACSGAINIRFGTTASVTTNPAIATDMYFPAGVYIYDVGHNNQAISIFSIAASTIITVSYVPRS